MNGLIKMALGAAGVPASTVAEIETSAPGAARLLDAAKQLEPYIQQAQPHIDAMMPHLQAMLPHIQALLPIVEKVTPIAKAVYPDLVALLPTAKDVVAFVDSKKPVAGAAHQQQDPSRLGSG